MEKDWAKSDAVVIIIASKRNKIFVRCMQMILADGKISDLSLLEKLVKLIAGFFN